jgi:hypothetical protein
MWDGWSPKILGTSTQASSQETHDNGVHRRWLSRWSINDDCVSKISNFGVTIAVAVCSLIGRLLAFLATTVGLLALLFTATLLLLLLLRLLLLLGLVREFGVFTLLLDRQCLCYQGFTLLTLLQSTIRTSFPRIQKPYLIEVFVMVLLAYSHLLSLLFTTCNLLCIASHQYLNT